jgi:hypothetical protein
MRSVNGMRARMGPALANAALSAGAVAVFAALLVAAEMAYRRLAPAYAESVGIDEGGLHVYSETYGWTLRRGFEGQVARARTTVNARGYRGPEHGPRTRARTRVVIVGDSVAFGYGVADEETFAAVLERAHGGLEVLNLAENGYGTDQALLKLEGEGLAYEPDVVVLSFCLANDFVDNAQCFSYGHPKPCFALEGGALRLRDTHLAVSRFARVVLFLQRESLLYNRALAAWAARPAPEADVPPELELTAALVRRVRDVARSRGARFLVVFHPGRDDLRPIPPRPTRKLVKMIGPPDTETLSLRDEYMARGYGLARFEELALDTTGHLGPAGHALTAAIVGERLCALGWIRCAPAARRAGPAAGG